MSDEDALINSIQPAIEGGHCDCGNHPAHEVVAAVLASDWLAEHDRQEREKAWDESARTHVRHIFVQGAENPRNPYRKQESNVVLPLDPEPWVYQDGERWPVPSPTDDEAPTFEPGDNYEQDREKYPAWVLDIDAACEVMHDAYERVAVVEGWETNPASRKPWSEVPEANKATMRAAVAALLAWQEPSRAGGDS